MDQNKQINISWRESSTKSHEIVGFKEMQAMSACGCDVYVDIIQPHRQTFTVNTVCSMWCLQIALHYVTDAYVNIRTSGSTHEYVPFHVKLWSREVRILYQHHVRRPNEQLSTCQTVTELGQPELLDRIPYPSQIQSSQANSIISHTDYNYNPVMRLC